MEKRYKMTKKELMDWIQSIIDDMVRWDCHFCACPGPNQPFKPMATCTKCSTIKELRRLRDAL